MDPSTLMLFGKLMNKVSSPENKLTYQQLEQTFNSIQTDHDSEAGNILQSLIDKMGKVIGALDPIVSLIEPFMVLIEIFEAGIEADLSDELASLFDTVLTPTNIAHIESLATNLGKIFTTIFNEEMLSAIGESITNIIKFLNDPIPYIISRSKTLWEMWFGQWAQYETGWWGVL